MSRRVVVVVAGLLYAGCGPDRTFVSSSTAGSAGQDNARAGGGGGGGGPASSGAGGSQPLDGGSGGSLNVSGSGGDAGMGGDPTPSDLCLGVACDMPPADACESADQFRSYDKIGSCDAGVCEYPTRLIECDCVAGACTTDPCIGITCTAPPVAICKDADTLTTYLASGTCSKGACSYTAADQACEFGCAMGACKPDPCSNVTCNAADQCHTNPGTCNSATGKCTYPNKTNGAACSNIDSNACTPDTCTAGVCGSAPAKTCPAPAACKMLGTCDTSTGACSTPNAANGTSCGTNVECQGGACVCTRASCPNGCCTAAGTCGSCTPVTLTTREERVRSLTIGTQFLYFLQTADTATKVFSISTGGGAVAELTNMPAPNSVFQIHADGSFIYANQGSNSTPDDVARMSILGGNFTSIAQDAIYAALRIRTNSTSIITGSTLSSNYIMIAPKSGGSGTILISSLNVNASSFTVDNSNVYLLSGSGSTLTRVPIASGEGATITSASSGETFDDLALAGTQLVLASSTRVAKISASATGGTAATLQEGSAYRIVSDATTAYFFHTNATNGTCTGGSEIYSIPVAGGTLRRLAIDPSTTCATSVVHDATGVYWLSGDTIKKVAK